MAGFPPTRSPTPAVHLARAQDVRAVQGVTMKLCGGGRSFARDMDVDAFVRQVSRITCNHPAITL